jgi:hypothetical protein
MRHVQLCFARALVLAMLLLTGLPDSVRPVGAAAPGPSLEVAAEVVSARLGISAGEDIADVPLGTDGPALRRHIPILFRTAQRLGVQIETVSVGQGFFSDNGTLQSEHDLDLVVRGRRADINALGAILGPAWDQSLVFIWYPGPNGPMATATLPLPGGTDRLTDAVYRQLVTELADGGHVRYAGPHSLLFVANTGNEPEAAFAARMQRVRQLLERAGVPVGPLQAARAEMLALTRDTYDDYIPGRCLRRAA